MWKAYFINHLASILSNPIEYLKGVGPLRADILKKELSIFTFKDLLEHFPIRHLDKTQINHIRDISSNTDYIQIAGKLISLETIGANRSKRLIGIIQDNTGELELCWFQGINWVQKTLQIGHSYLVYGKISFFQQQPQISHPEIEPLNSNATGKPFLEPIYPTTEKLKTKGLNGRQLGKLTSTLLSLIHEQDIPENLPNSILQKLHTLNRYQAITNIHFPNNTNNYAIALRRLKFEEFFIAQIRLGLTKIQRHRHSAGAIFNKVGEYFNTFYQQYLPFALTQAQKRVLKEIRNDIGSGKQMNRLLQGDVGSGKTIVALLSMLIAADNGYQSCIMSPTEILAQQHFNTISDLIKHLPLQACLLTGSTKKIERKKILEDLASGKISILIATHTVIEDIVIFNKLGLAVIDEQHRFGVEQRAKLWKKANPAPHVLVMTATPIPRTLAMTAYGDLDYSVIDELPPGRQSIITVHRYERQRIMVMDFIKTEIAKGRQAYIVFPLIEESEKLDYENLMQGYEHIKAFFPEPKYWISVVHGRQTSKEKELNMQRFVQGDTQIMVATTVIEVGVNVPNASIMLIESAEKFGLSQLHQLRGRVGRGSEKSYCILLSSSKLSNDARERIKIITATQNGFMIAEKDMELRGPGDIEGTRQSGMLNFKIANLIQDREILNMAKTEADILLNNDPNLQNEDSKQLKNYLYSLSGKTAWSKIS